MKLKCCISGPGHSFDDLVRRGQRGAEKRVFTSGESDGGKGPNAIKRFCRHQGAATLCTMTLTVMTFGITGFIDIQDNNQYMTLSENDFRWNVTQLNNRY